MFIVNSLPSGDPHCPGQYHFWANVFPHFIQESSAKSREPFQSGYASEAWFTHGRTRDSCPIPRRERAPYRARHLAHRPTLLSYPHGHSARNRLTPWITYLRTIVSLPGLPIDKVESCPTHGKTGKIKSSTRSSGCFDTWADLSTAPYSSRSAMRVNVS